MSKVETILEEIKGLTLLEASDLVKKMDLVRTFSFNHGLLGDGAKTVDVVGIEFPGGATLGNKANLKMRFDPGYMQLAADGNAALGAATRRRYDLILMDCHMPQMDGFEATRRIRDDEFERSRGHTPIVALTADALAGDRERCLESGMDDYMTKPVSSAMLAACVERWTGRKTAAPSQW